jgi:hypothetical protein
MGGYCSRHLRSLSGGPEFRPHRAHHSEEEQVEQDEQRDLQDEQQLIGDHD